MTAFTRNGLVKLDVPDIMSVLLIPGSGRQVWEGVGDAIFIDGRRRIVAVADGSERNPSAGAAFLRRFRSGISDVIDPQMELILSDEVMGNLASATNLLIRGTSFHDGTTFSAVIVGHDNHFAILHTGDSLIFKLRPSGGAVLQLSQTNHRMVGRTLGLSQVEKASYQPGDILLIASDGLLSLARYHGQGSASFLSDLVKQCATPVEMMERIRTCAQRITQGLDDIGVVMLEPDRLFHMEGDLQIPSILP
jgi:serine/threonine protein phosphatase PrpC